MKKHLPLLISLLLCTNLGIAQSSVVADIDLANKQFTNVKISDSFSIPGSQKKDTLSFPEKVAGLSAKLENNEIVLTYRLKKTAKEQYYRIGLTATLDGKPLPTAIRPEQVSGAYGPYVIVEDNSTILKTIWGDLIPSYLNLEGELAIDLEVSLERSNFLEVCEKGRPTFFTWKDQKWHAVAGVVGLGSLIAGQTFKNRRDDNYQTYTNLSEEFNSAGATKKAEISNEHPRLLEEAKDQDDQYRFFSWVGAGILAGDLIWELIRFAKFERDNKDFYRYCTGQNKVSLRPVILPGTLSSTAGMQLKVRF